MIFISNLTMRFGAKILFEKVQFQLNPGCHYGLVGANGCGKSTLIKILAGEMQPDSGEVILPSQLKLGTLSQNHFIYENTTILDVVMMGNAKLWKALSDKETLLNTAHFTEDECHQLDDLEKIIASEDGYAAPSIAANLIEGLGIPANVHMKPMSVLSGGYKLRVLLAQVLFSKPDILLLDEPTNHLDLFSIKWLEEYLKSFPGTLLISSHDRDFLNGVCNYIVDVDHETIAIYKGNYEQFVESKAENLEQRAHMLDKQQKKRDDLQEFIDRFKAKASKARQAQSKMRFAEKLENEMDSLNLAPSSRMYPKVSFEQVRPSGQVVLKVNQLSKAYGAKQVLEEVSFEIERGERVSFLGANGIGKSTLLEILTGHRKPDNGAFEWGFAAYPSYFPQDHKREVNHETTLLEWLGQQDPLAPEQRVREVLARVLFSGDDVKKNVSILSGGETARLILAKMMLTKHNILIFDEPTNHLDMEATETLLEALDKYEGTILFVSHNRHFVSRLANRIIEITPDGLHDFRSTYQEYVEKREYDLLVAKKKAAPVKTEQAPVKFTEEKNQRKERNQSEKQAKALEEKCHRIEQEIQKIDAELSAPDFYVKTAQDKQKQILNQKAKLEKDLEIAFCAWEEASKS